MNLEALARVPTVPNMPGVHPVPTLPTITEAKVADDSGTRKKVTVFDYRLTVPNMPGVQPDPLYKLHITEV